jgi:hypothetical protein
VHPMSESFPLCCGRDHQWCCTASCFRRIVRRPSRRRLLCRKVKCRALWLSAELISSEHLPGGPVLEATDYQSRSSISGVPRRCDSSSEWRPRIVGMGSCAGSQCTTRKIHALGHEVRLIRAQFVNPYVKSKNIYITDTEAIAEAATRPTTRLATLESE